MEQLEAWENWFKSKLKFIMIILIIESIIFQNLIQHKAIFVYNEMTWLTAIDRTINSSILVIILLDLPKTLKTIWVGFFLTIHPYYCQRDHQKEQLILETDSELLKRKPVSLLRMSGNTEYVRQNFIWVEVLTPGDAYSPFGYLSRYFRSPVTVFLIGFFPLISFLIQASITGLAWWDNMPSSYYPFFLPLLITAVVTGVLPNLFAACLKSYHRSLVNSLDI
ncbi:hypothetical protein K502DRAFT_347031 [Neoconidiobolus thromboides FSU 785]|nr:hypothetical protein K502DRAFT_347031 [Neoconidiobolus thromboides FSU 785]